MTSQFWLIIFPFLGWQNVREALYGKVPQLILSRIVVNENNVRII